MRLRRTKAVMRKEFLHVLRDSRSLFMALAVPFLLLLLFGYALSLDVDHIPTVVFDRDRTPESRDLVDLFEGSRYFQVIDSVDRYKPLQDKIDNGDCLLGLVIPRDYGRHLKAGEEAQVQLLLDGGEANSASITLGYSQALLLSYGVQLRATALNIKGGGQMVMPVASDMRIWYNSELKSKNFIVPGLIAIILMIVGTLLTTLTIAREWETGTMEQLLSTPIRPAELVGGKMVAYFSIGMIDLAIAMALGIFIFGVPFRGNLLFIGVSSCVFTFGALCWGILVSATMKNQLQAYQMGMLTSYLPTFMLSGYIFAISNMPLPIRAITYLVSSRYFIRILQGTFMKGIGLSYLWPELTMLAVYALGVFYLATRQLRKKLG